MILNAIYPESGIGEQSRVLADYSAAQVLLTVAVNGLA